MGRGVTVSDPREGVRDEGVEPRAIQLHEGRPHATHAQRNVLYTAQATREALKVALVRRRGVAHDPESDERPRFAPA
jgi:hypothetical protein